MLNHIEEGSISVFWITATNPLVSLPDLERIRTLFTKKDLFVVVQDIFMTETAEIADVVLPGAASGEKTGCFTNVDRTVHISHKAVEPPGQAKTDFEIFVDFAKRMDFKNKNGDPLVWWKIPEEAFAAWQKCSAGRPCDYTGMSYEKLSIGSGIQWPCNEENPNGTERLFTDGKFFTDIDVCESYGHDLETGAPLNRDQYLEMSPRGRAIIKTAEYRQREEMPNDEYPLSLSTGRNVYHFHTRTKTGRIPELQKARPNAVVQISNVDAKLYGIKDGEDVIVSSRRGNVQVPARVGDIEPGQVFIPFHYGYWDDAEKARAANELTTDTWDFISKQPVFKSGAVKVKPAGVEIHGVHRPIVPERTISTAERKVRLLESFIEKLGIDLSTLREMYSRLREKEKVYELREGMHVLQDITTNMQSSLEPVFGRYGVAEKIQNTQVNLEPPKSDVLSMLQYIFTHLSQVQAHIIILTPTAGAMWDAEFVETIAFCEKELGRQISWARNEMSVRSPQTLIVPKI
jgi:ferredoxin-nitrate reductase